VDSSSWSRVYTTQVGSHESSTGDARADVSSELRKVRQGEIWSELRFPLFDLHETSARAFPTPDSRESTCMAQTRLYGFSSPHLMPGRQYRAFATASPSRGYRRFFLSRGKAVRPAAHFHLIPILRMGGELNHLCRLGGVVVSVPTTGPKSRGFKPSRGEGLLRTIEKPAAHLPSDGKWSRRSHVVRFYWI
jgi:hypothetical protein